MNKPKCKFGRCKSRPKAESNYCQKHEGKAAAYRAGQIANLAKGWDASRTKRITGRPLYRKAIIKVTETEAKTTYLPYEKVKLPLLIRIRNYIFVQK